MQKPLTNSISSSSVGGNPLSDFQAIIDEAALIFAGGDEASAAQQILDFLTKTKGNADRRVWFMLLDIYYSMNQKERFEALSLNYAYRFNTSPPSWSWDASEEQAANTTVNTSGAANVLIIEGPITGSLTQRSKEFMATAKKQKTCKIDISRLRLEQSDIDGISCLLALMIQLRKWQVAATLMGDNHVVSWLQSKVDQIKTTKNPQHSPYWLLLLELLQWKGQMEPFEDLSFEYTLTFELSGPGWEPDGVMTIETVDEPPPTSSDSDFIEPEAIITDITIQNLSAKIQEAYKANGKVKLNFKKVKRMEFSAAGAFTGILSTLGAKPEQIILDSPSELIIALLEVVGATQLFKINPRKR